MRLTLKLSLALFLTLLPLAALAQTDDPGGMTPELLWKLSRMGEAVSSMGTSLPSFAISSVWFCSSTIWSSSNARRMGLATVSRVNSLMMTNTSSAIRPRASLCCQPVSFSFLSERGPRGGAGDPGAAAGNEHRGRLRDRERPIP